MQITRIDFDGDAASAIAKRRYGTNHIEVTILKPDQPNGREHEVQADCEEDLHSMADCLQHELDGRRGTTSEIHDYYRQLLLLSDC